MTSLKDTPKDQIPMPILQIDMDIIYLGQVSKQWNWSLITDKVVAHPKQMKVYQSIYSGNILWVTETSL